MYSTSSSESPISPPSLLFTGSSNSGDTGDANLSAMSTPEVTISLRRNSTERSWGFQLHGGHDVQGGLPIFVHRVMRNSIAHRAGLEPGDVVLRIGRLWTYGFTRAHYKAELLRAGNELDFLVNKRAFDVLRFNQLMACCVESSSHQKKMKQQARPVATATCTVRSHSLITRGRMSHDDPQYSSSRQCESSSVRITQPFSTAEGHSPNPTDSVKCATSLVMTSPRVNRIIARQPQCFDPGQTEKSQLTPLSPGLTSIRIISSTAPSTKSLQKITYNSPTGDASPPRAPRSVSSKSYKILDEESPLIEQGEIRPSSIFDRKVDERSRYLVENRQTIQKAWGEN